MITSVLPLPLAHAYGLLVICGGMHRTDQPRTVLMRWFDPAGWLKLATAHRIQGTALVPSMIQMLLSQPLEEADLSELAFVSSGAAPLADDVRREFEARCPVPPSTRATAAPRQPRSSRPTRSAHAASAASGKPIPHVELDHPRLRRPGAARGPGR